MKCISCGGKMENWGASEWRCVDCANTYDADDGSWDWEDEDEYEDKYGDDENGKSFACRACGDPAWPDCMSGCNLYDD